MAERVDVNKVAMAVSLSEQSGSEEDPSAANKNSNYILHDSFVFFYFL